MDRDPTRDGARAADEATPHVVQLSDGRRRSHLAVKAFDDHGRPTIIEHSFIVEPECHGWRLDRFLMKRMRRISRARIQRVIRHDLEVNGARVTRPSTPVREGDTVTFRRPAPREPDVPREIRLLVSDDLFIALDKPAGLPIHPTARYHYSTLTAVLRERFPDDRFEVCHRLDRETSGVLLAARVRIDVGGRARSAGPELKGLFARRKVHKSYLAIVRGELDHERVIDEPIGPGRGEVTIAMGVRPIADGGQPARTTVRPRQRYRGYTLVEASPHTGRQHQIRVHLAAIGLPVVGDKLYPDEEPFIAWSEDRLDETTLARLELPRHALHAASLRFPHPATGEEVVIECPLPPDLQDFLSNLDRLEPDREGPA